MKAFTNY